MTEQNITQSPVNPQYQLGPTSSEAELNQQITKSPLEGPGGIVRRLDNQQWQLPRAQPDANMTRDTHGLPNG